MQLLPISIRPAARLISSDLVIVKPLGPPSFNLNYYYEYDNTKWLLEQRLKKIEKIRERINETTITNINKSII
jgi:hypothetical protein